MSWNMDFSLNSLNGYDRSKKDKPEIPYNSKRMREILQTPVLPSSGYRIAILTTYPITSYEEILPLITEPILGNSINSILVAIDKGLDEPIKIRADDGIGSNHFSDRERFKDLLTKIEYRNSYLIHSFIYNEISTFFNSDMRKDFVIKYEEGNLTPGNLLGDHKFFEGFTEFKRFPKILRYNTGS